MKHLKFLKSPQSFNSEVDFVAHLSGIDSKEELFKQLNNKLEMPGYFGFNWDALFDCLRDFHWIEQHKIIIVHDDCPHIKDHELSTYFQILHEAVLDWKEGEEHSLVVIFPQSVKSYLEKIIF